MRTARTLSIAAALGTVLCLAASAGDVIPEYANEFETPWFDAGISNLTKGQTLLQPPWSWVSATEFTVEAGKITLDTDFDAPLSYTPANACSNVAVVAATMTAAVNASVPAFTDNPQAALTVIGTSTSTNWIGLVGDGAGGTDWVTFASPVPVAGQEYSVRIEFDQRSTKRIRYLVNDVVLVDGAHADGWYPNPSAGSENISKVSFSGSGDIMALSGNNVLDASFDMDDDFGYDFTNGLVTVSNVDVGGATAKAKITVIDCKTGAAFGGTEQTVGTDPVSWDLAAVLEDHALVAGGDYTYEVEIKVGDTTVARKSATFLAANWTENTWFGADASKTEGSREIGGAWDSTKHPEGVVDDAYVIDDDALFNVTVQDDGTNKVTRVDAVVTFDAFVTNPATPGGDAFGGFVAAKDGDAPAQWKALTTDGWVALTGAAAPVLQTEYTVRAEVDFLSKNRRVRYFVKTGLGEFLPLACGDSDWISLVGHANTFTSVEFQGSGTLAKFEATIADKSLAEVGGERYDSMADALAAARDSGEEITLLTNATVEPTEKGKYEISAGDYQYVSGGKVSSGDKTIIVDEGGKPLVRPSEATMQKVKTPDGRLYESYDSLRAFLEKNKVDGYTKDDADEDSITTALNKEDTNSLLYWQDYALGIDVGTPVNPVTIPTGDTDKDHITLAIPAVTAPSGDYDIDYKVMKGTDVKTSTKSANDIEVPLDTGLYDIKVIFTAPAAQVD